ncbi:SDR family NAD(P)-dependent oxidoreductase [Acaryochloris sp. IP29b_bin.137]|uniref:SDR family NAD(P)-dependent oxidoreductase n=1 Tax=Acaryochloris sp. IP29b_bin.137 TaxID=2969217 RepID=UPI002625BDB2|nr:SDR family NAD(P)-dependent oxidoreductase [Acaryochloris sp. IP29b_bin.137]
MTELNNAVVLLTGATGGFGQELTQLLLAAGSRVMRTDIDANLLEQQSEVLHQHTHLGELLPSIVANLGSEDGCKFLYQQVQSLCYPIDILINNAGIAMYGRMDEIPAQNWELMMQINLLAPMRLCNLLVKEMIARRRGHIVNISSVAGWMAPSGLTAYATSKFGLRGLSEGLRNDVKHFNVKVTAVYPFFSRTPILHSDSFGSLAQGTTDLPNWLTTDPHKIMQATVRGIQQNKAEVFPDVQGQVLTRLKRYMPRFLQWSSTRIIEPFQNPS